jgi:hypothetical protein
VEKKLEPSEWEALLKFAEKLLGRQLPGWLQVAIGLLILIAVVLAIVAAMVFLAGKIKQGWRDHLRPQAYGPEQKHRLASRQAFAQYLAEQIEKRNRAEKWQDSAYAELEAEVEAEDRRHRIFSFRRNTRIVRREKSLAAALQRSDERLVLVEGDPGSGKSVALRHVALHLATRAKHSKRLDSVLPVYVNLKELKRPPKARVDAELIRTHVLDTLHSVPNNFVDSFIEGEFDKGLTSGSWMFLFDSFDELPDVLSATDADESVTSYSEAVSDFLSVAHGCRGILASRFYKGPRATGWSTFTILPLSAQRQRYLIRRVTPDYDAAQKIEAELATASEDIQTTAQNPMLLALICEQMKLTHVFPRNSFDLLSRYVTSRFSKDAERVAIRFKLATPEVEKVAQAAAFAMTEDEGLGLSPRRASLEAAIAQRTGLGRSHIAKATSALIYMRLARTDDTAQPEFTFAHRRFQEYFATQVLLQGTYAVHVSKLLTDARWRESAVALLQHEDPARSEPLLKEAALQLDAAKGATDETRTMGTDSITPWLWPKSVLHILGIVHSGTSGSTDKLDRHLRTLVGYFVHQAFRQGDLLDAKLALQIAGPASESTIVSAMTAALAAKSIWLEDAAYWLAARLSRPHPSVRLAISRSISRMSDRGELSRQYASTKAFLARLPAASVLLNVLRYAYWIPVIDAAALILLGVIASMYRPEMAAGAVGTKLVADEFKRRFPGRPTLEASAGLLRLATPGILLLAMDKAPGTLISIPTGLPTWLPEPLAVLLATFSEAASAHKVYALFLAWWLVWRPSAEACVKIGKYASPLLWPLAPLVIAVEQLAWQRMWLRLKSDWPLFIKEIPQFLLFLLLVGSGLGAVAWLVLKYPMIAKVSIFISGFIIGLPIFYAVIYQTTTVIRSLLTYRLDRKMARANLAKCLARPSEFIGLFRVMRTRFGENYLLRQLISVDVARQKHEWNETLRTIVTNNPHLDRLSRFSRLSEPQEQHAPTSAWSWIMQYMTSLTILDWSNDPWLLEQRDLVYTLLERVVTV